VGRQCGKIVGDNHERKKHTSILKKKRLGIVPPLAFREATTSAEHYSLAGRHSPLTRGTFGVGNRDDQNAAVDGEDRPYSRIHSELGHPEIQDVLFSKIYGGQKESPGRGRGVFNGLGGSGTPKERIGTAEQPGRCPQADRGDLTSKPKQ